MIKTVFVPLIVKAAPDVETAVASKLLTSAMNAALEELDTALDDGWRIIAQQYIDSRNDSGTVFFIRDDAREFLELTDEALEELDEEDTKQITPVSPPIEAADFRGWG